MISVSLLQLALLAAVFEFGCVPILLVTVAAGGRHVIGSIAKLILILGLRGKIAL